MQLTISPKIHHRTCAIEQEDALQVFPGAKQTAIKIVMIKIQELRKMLKQSSAISLIERIP